MEIAQSGLQMAPSSSDQRDIDIEIFPAMTNELQLTGWTRELC